VVVLADGMGGYNAGEVASGIAVAVITTGMQQALDQREPAQPASGGGEAQGLAMLRDEIRKANTAVYQTAQNQPQCSGMGTTLVATLFFDNSMTVAHIGDSRLYRLRGESLDQVTRDHSLLQEQIDSGMITKEQARFSQNKNLVTRALGIEPEVEAEIHTYPVEPGDIYLLCSDGLNDMVEDDDIRLTLVTLKGNLQVAAEQLVQMANDNGGRDNVSVILVRVARPFPTSRGILSRFFSWLK
jgi:protein phosphatase